jgi:hypothetical protein
MIRGSSSTFVPGKCEFKVPEPGTIACSARRGDTPPQEGAGDALVAATVAGQLRNSGLTKDDAVDLLWPNFQTKKPERFPVPAFAFRHLNFSFQNFSY